MKINACALAALLIFETLASAAYALEPDDLDVRQSVRQYNQEAWMTMFEKSKTDDISRLPALQAKSRLENRSAPIAEAKDTLCGLNGVMVFVEEIDTDVENHGLTKSLVKDEVESRLRQADIPVLSVDEAFNMPGKPYLYLNLTTHNTGIEFYSYSIRIELNQDVSMIREPSIRASATTWIANMVGVVGARNLPAVTEDVNQLTNQFIRDYLAANRK